MSEETFKKFKRWLKGHLAFGPVIVTFTKKDGTERVMNCTTNKELVPPVEVNKTVEKKERKVNEDTMPVYDLEVKAWKSFRWDSIKQVRFEL